MRGILEKHGSQARMASEPGVGTTFWFDLPLEEADGDELRVQAERSASLADIEAERRIAVA